MQLHYLHFFIQAVECKSLNRAARKLDISPQRLSSGVASLEKALGYSLLVRSPYGVYPTEKGLIVYEDAVKFADIYNKWLNMASSSSHRTHSINVKIGASTALMRWLVP
ncbi:MAG: LysR family transcriptional regulator, partial [Mailhella sp.]